MKAMVRSRARCKKDHEVEFRPFHLGPIKHLWKRWTHWAMCPVLQEPILMMLK